MAGVPCIRGTQIPVSAIIGRIAEGMTTAEILAEYPQLDTDDIAAAVTFTAVAVDVRELSLVDPITHAYADSPYIQARRMSSLRRRGERVEGLAAELVAPPDDVGTELGLAPGEWAIRRRSLTVDDAGPVELSTSWFAGRLADLAPRLLKPANVRGGTVSYVERMTDRRAATTNDSIAVRLATAEERRLLDLAGSRPPVVVVHQIVLDSEGSPLELVEAVVSLARWAVAGDGADGAAASAVSTPDAVKGADHTAGRAALGGVTRPLGSGSIDSALQPPTARDESPQLTDPGRVPPGGPGREWLDQYGPLVFVGVLALVFIGAVTVLIVVPWR